MNDTIQVLSLGAGVQSSTLALMAARGEVEPMPKCAIFADTQTEPPAVYKWLDWLEAQLPFPVYRVTKGDLAEGELRLRTSKKSGFVYRKALIPAYTDDGGMTPRKCTSDYKIQPIVTKLREIASIPRGCKEVRVIQWIGISMDETIRMKPSREPWIENRWPLIEKRISRRNCLEWWAKNGLPEPPRSACYFCPFHSNAEWARMQKDEPEEFAKAIEFEKKMDAVAQQETGARRVRVFLHPSRRPLSEIDFLESNQMRLGGSFGNECEGMCGV